MENRRKKDASVERLLETFLEIEVASANREYQTNAKVRDEVDRGVARFLSTVNPDTPTVSEEGHLVQKLSRTLADCFRIASSVPVLALDSGIPREAQLPLAKYFEESQVLEGDELVAWSSALLLMEKFGQGLRVSLYGAPKGFVVSLAIGEYDPVTISDREMVMIPVATSDPATVVISIVPINLSAGS